MSDLSIEVFYICQSAEQWETTIQSDKKSYQVRWDNFSHKNHNVQYDYSCSCQGYKFRGKCRHIEEARKRHCNWTQFTDGDEPKLVNGNKVCPNCGLPVEARRYAV